MDLETRAIAAANKAALVCLMTRKAFSLQHAQGVLEGLIIPETSEDDDLLDRALLHLDDMFQRSHGLASILTGPH